MAASDVLGHPSKEQPDAYFKDGTDVYVVRVVPRNMPTWGTGIANASASGAIVYALLWALIAFLLWKVGDRSKVVVLRRKDVTLGWFQKVVVEFFPTKAAAEARRLEILEKWTPGQFADTPPVRRP